MANSQLQPSSHSEREVSPSLVKRCYMCKEHLSLDLFYKNQSACKPCQRDYRRNNVDVRFKEGLAAWKHGLKKLGLTPDDYDELFEKQGGVCAICNREDANGRRLAVDHCHETGKIRGLLCRKCNMGIGLLGDNADLVEKALCYLTA